MSVRKFIDNFEQYFVVWGLAFMTALIFIQVAMRYVFSYSLSWSEELARYIFLWISWVGASYAVKERSHFRVEMFANMLKGKNRRKFEFFILIVWFLFSFGLAWWGTELVMFIQRTGQVSAAIRMPMTIPYSSAPIGCVLMCIRLVIEIVKLCKGNYSFANDAVSKGETL
jgi:TRAP-type C4-dicarboxylate transport system permease small subunit